VVLSQRDQAYTALQRLLILQKIPEGERLREPQWAKELGVNRMALREAFARLEAEGLIVRGPATGYFVPTLTSEDIAEIIQLRIALESLAIRQLCGKKSSGLRELATLSQACDQFERFMNDGYPLGVIEADRRFHESLITAAKNNRLTMLYQRAPLPVIHRKVADERAWQRACEQTLKEHRALLRYLRARNERAAIRQIERHLDRRSTIPVK
jgi:DNA-binding GntR family transcriptional regulator